MKTKFSFNPLLILLPIFIAILIISCSKEEIVVIPESNVSAELSLKSADVPTPGDMICDLIAGKSIDVGKVVYSDDGINLLVEYIATGGWILSEVHFYIGNMEDFEETCMNKKAVQIGHFPYSATNINDETKSFSIPLDGIEPEDDGSYLVIAHAVVMNGDQNETAFANCAYQPVITTVKGRFENDSEDEFFGESEGTPFIDFDPAYWCSFLGTNTYEGEATYPIGSWGNYYGEAHVYDDGETLFIEVTANEGLSIVGTWAYVGPLMGLQAYLSNESYDGVCPEYWNFPLASYVKETSHTFSVPLPTPTETSISFKDAFNINRWGWISYYTPN